MHYENSILFAKKMDKSDALKPFRDYFYQPNPLNGQRCIYFCGNSLGLQPRRARTMLDMEILHWREQGVLAWHNESTEWLDYHNVLSEKAAPLVGALPSEVVMMNTLTVNLHLMMASFYRPTKRRFKILMESNAFSSDQYAIESQLRWHGFDPVTALVELSPRAGEACLRMEDIEAAIKNEGKSVALVLFSGVQYYTGQFFDLKKIARAAQKVGATVGFDLAHAVGNVPLALHEIGADFAVWCTYKYLNSGPGGVGGAFVHQKHHDRTDLPRLAGWWGYNLEKRFKMQSGFEPMLGAAGWQVSTAQIFPFALHRGSLEIIEEAGGMEIMRQKSIQLTEYLAFLLGQSPYFGKDFKIITPENPAERGAQLSLLFSTEELGRSIFKKMTDNAVIGDWREPNVIRLAPVPLYNTFEEVWKVGNLFH